MSKADIKLNPWPGLSSYKDPNNCRVKLKFCGRDSDAYDVWRLIDDNLFVTLYGKSGIGKTSLLNAGVFPFLRKEQYIPLSLRLGICEEDLMFQDFITQTIERVITEAGGWIEIINVVEEQNDKNAIDYLWCWFARRVFYNKDKLMLFPVVVLDQFEELFHNKRLRLSVDVLMAQLNYIIDESHALSDCIVNGREYYYDFNFRFVVSIREDDLYSLEDCIDNNYFPALKCCRYRLRSLTDKGAEDVIRIPGEGLFSEVDKDKIIKNIIDKSRNVDGSISTNIISLLCNRIYTEFVRSNADYISLSLVDEFIKGNPFECFYKEATRGLSNRERMYIEEHLVDSDGRRNSVSEGDFLLKIKNGEKLLKGETRILQRLSTSSSGDICRIELIHDSFCSTLRRLNEKRKKRKRILEVVLIFFVSFILLVSAILLFQNTRLEAARNEIIEMNKRLYRKYFCVVAEKAQGIINSGNSYLARMAALELLPDDYDNLHNVEQYIPEVEVLMRSAFKKNDAVILGHKNRVNTAIFSPDGKSILSASDDMTLRVWDVKSGKQIYSLQNEYNKREVTSASFSPDSKCIVSTSAGKKIYIWDVESIECGHKRPDSIDVYYNHSDIVRCASFSPNGEYIALASDDRTISIWNVSGGYIYGMPLKGHTDAVKYVSYSSDSKRLVSASANGEIRIWDAMHGVPIDTLPKGHESAVNSVSFSPDGKRIVSASDDTKIIIWDLQTGRKRTLHGHTESVKSAFFSPDGKRIVSASNDRTVRVWDAETGKHEIYTGHTQAVNFASFSPDGKCVVSASDDNTIRLWDVRDVSVRFNLKCSSNIKTVSFSPDGERVVSAFDDKTVRIWDVDSGTFIGNPLEHTDVVASAFFTSDGKRIISISVDPSGSKHKYSTIWDAAEGKLVSSLSTEFVNLSSFDSVAEQAVYINNNCVNVCDVDIGVSKVISYNLIKGDKSKKYDEKLLSVSISPDAKLTALVAENKTIYICDTKSGKQIGKPLKGHSMAVNSVSFTSDGKRLISASDDKTVRVWDAVRCVSIGKPLEHTEAVGSAFFSSDGKRIFSMSKYYKTIYVWDVKSGVLLDRINLENMYEIPASVSVSRDGRRIVVAYTDGSISVLKYPSLQELIDSACKQFKGRDMSIYERNLLQIDDSLRKKNASLWH